MPFHYAIESIIRRSLVPKEIVVLGKQAARCIRIPLFSEGVIEMLIGFPEGTQQDVPVRRKSGKSFLL